MKHLEDSIKLVLRFIILIIPFYVLHALPALIGTDLSLSIASFLEIGSFIGKGSSFLNPFGLLSIIGSMLTTMIGSVILSIILRIVATPMTYGMAKKAILTDSVDFNDMVPSLLQNLKQFIFFMLGSFVFWSVLSIASSVLLIVFGYITSFLKWFGLFLYILLFLAMIAILVVISVLTSFWLPTMIMDGYGIIDGFKKSIELAKPHLGTILLVQIIITVSGSILGSILKIFGFIPFIGTLIQSIVPAAVSLVSLLFILLLYQDTKQTA